MLARVREQFRNMTRPKAISHHPELAGREHVYRQGAGMIVQALDNYADYATAYAVYTWVHKAVSMVAENMAGLPVGVVDSSNNALEGHPLSVLLLHVNEEETPVDLWSKYIVNMMLGGEAPLEIVPDRAGRPAELWLRRPDRIAVVPDVTRLAYPTAIGYIFEPEDTPSMPINIEAQWMVFDKFYNPINPWRGLAPIHAVREGITIDMFAQAWSKTFLRNNTRPDFAIVAPQGITQSEKNDYESRFLRKHAGVENAHLPVVLEQGVTDIKVLSFPPKDIEWLQQREFARDEVGAIFGVPDELMGFGKDTYENFQTALTIFWTLTMLPLTRHRDGVLTQHFRRYGWLKPTERIATDISGVGVLREDMTPKIDQATKLFAMGVPFNQLDEVLGLGIGPVEGGDVGYLSNSLTSASVLVNSLTNDDMATGGNKDVDILGYHIEQGVEILGYHIEQGVVSHNEARAELGFPPRDEAEDNANRQLRTKLELMTLARSAGITPASAAELVGLDVEIEEPEPPSTTGDNTPPNEDEREEPEPQQRLYLPEGAKEQAKRVIKKMIQELQNTHLQAVRHGAGVDPNFRLEEKSRGELRRWLGVDADAVADAIERVVFGMTGDHDTVNAAYNALKSDESIAQLLEVEAAAPFFTIALPKQITPEWVKVMVLRLDREDDEAEQQIRMALDRRTTRNLTQVFNDMLETLYPEGYGEWQDPNIEAQRVRREFEENQALYDALSRALQDGTDLGVSVAVDQLENIGFSFDWTLANTVAREWALRHTGDLIRDIANTSQRATQQAVARWIDNGEPLESLIQDLEPLFGRKRAERIAITETTRAYQMGSEQAWRDSGVVSQMEWQTVRDERVCPQCGPMQGQRAPLGGTFNGVSAPPRHVRCRCFTRPIVDEA